MFEVTEKNHYRFSWDGQAFVLPKSPQSIFAVGFGSVRRRPFSFREECVIAARKIAERTSKPIAVALSGGLDSEVVARSFHEARVPFYCLTLRYPKALNEHDIVYAQEYCQEAGIRLEIVDLDIERFWQTELFGYCQKYGVYSTHRPVMMWLADHVNDCLVIGGGDLKIQRQSGSTAHFIKEGSDSAAQVAAAVLNGQQVCSRFFVYTPELMLAFLQNQDVKEFLVASQAMRLLNLKKYKPSILRRLWPDLRARAKYHGFEFAEAEDFALRERLNRELAERWPVGSVRFDVHQLTRNLEGTGLESEAHPLS